MADHVSLAVTDSATGSPARRVPGHGHRGGVRCHGIEDRHEHDLAEGAVVGRRGDGHVPAAVTADRRRAAHRVERCYRLQRAPTARGCSRACSDSQEGIRGGLRRDGEGAVRGECRRRRVTPGRQRRERAACRVRGLQRAPCSGCARSEPNVDETRRALIRHQLPPDQRREPVRVDDDAYVPRLRGPLEV